MIADGIVFGRTGNHHTVEDGRFYRSAQLSGPELAHEIDAHHIRTVLNLRGPNPSKGWYQDELVETQAHGAAHYDVGISARSPVPEDKLAKILAILPSRLREESRHGSLSPAFFKASRSTWYVQVRGRRFNLGGDREKACVAITS